MVDPIDQAARMAALVEKGPLALVCALSLLGFIWLLRVHLRDGKGHAATVTALWQAHAEAIARIHEAGREEAIALRIALTKFLLHIEREQTKAARRHKKEAPDVEQD